MISISVDVTNPGQFFACCGVFELAHRLWPGTTASFTSGRFTTSTGDLRTLVDTAASAPLTSLVETDKAASPLNLGGPFGLRLDWWKPGAGEPSLKTWAGKMQVARIALAMRRELVASLEEGFLQYGVVVKGADKAKVEPFYFDARRGTNALPLDLGFSPDAHAFETVAFPASEFFALIGLQRFRSRPVRTRVFEYLAWNRMLPIRLAALAVNGAIEVPGDALQFEAAFRSEYSKSFTSATPARGVEND
jgi:CRISPR-associated protein Csb3